MEEEFQFLLCQRCGKEAENPKLLFCLHNLCTECLEESKPIGQCPLCCVSIQRAGGEALLDNLLFASLQEKLSTYRKITANRDLVCNRCKEEAEFWCNECNEFLCSRCHDAHQWYLKQRNHESQKLLDLKNNTAQCFLKEARKSCILFCSEPSHSNQVVSIYCRGCHKPLCCSCALLDGEHYNAKFYCGIQAEIESRKEDLQNISSELEEKKEAYDRAHNSIHNHMQRLDKLRDETQALIRDKVDEMVQWVRQKGDELLKKVDRQLKQEREDVEKKLRVSEHFVSRVESGKRLVEKMKLFASDQEVLDMHPFIRESLNELRKERLPVVNVQGRMEDFAEVRSELHSLFQRVKGEKGAAHTSCVAQPAASAANSEVLQDAKKQPRPAGMSVPTSPNLLSPAKTSRGSATLIAHLAKRASCQSEKAVQASSKVLKLETHACQIGEPSSRYTQERAASAGPRPACASTPEQEPEQSSGVVEVNSSPETHESEATSIVIGSSDDNDDDEQM